MNVIRFLRWMTERGWGMGLYGQPKTRMYREATNAGIPAYPIISTLHAGDLLNSWRLAQRARADNVRYLIVHRSQDLFVGAAARWFSGGRLQLIYSQHMHIGTDKKDFYHAWLYRQIDLFITPVQWLADRVLEKTVVPEAKLHIIPRGIEVERFTTGKLDKVAARERFKLPADSAVIGLFGRLDPKKGQDTAIKALAQVHAAGYRPHLLLMGDKSFDEGDQFATSLHTLVRDEQLDDYVHFHSHDSRVEDGYAALDFFVMASKSECYGMVTIEALVSGVPVIGTNDGGTLSLIDPGRNGLLVKAGDVRALAEAMTTLLHDQEILHRMGDAAAAEAKVRFSHISQCEAWEKLLEL